MLIQIKTDKPEDKKFTHDEVGYEEPSTHLGERCKNCEHFIPATGDSPAGCEGVQRPIAETAWCHRWKEQMKKHPYSHTVIEHHEDGSHTVHHIHGKHGHQHSVPTRDGDVKHAASHHDAMIDSMMEHTSNPNPGERNDENNEAMPAAAPAAPVAPAVAPPAGA